MLTKLHQLEYVYRHKKVFHYPLSDSEECSVRFSFNQVILCLYLINFSYFDKEMLQTSYLAISRKEKLQTNWIQSCIGKRNHPFSKIDDFKYGRRHVYYLNKKFVRWLINIVHSDEIFSDYLYLIKSENILDGGKPKTINAHDFNCRLYVSQITKEISFRAIQKRIQEVLPYVYFPTSRRNKTAVADAVIQFGERYYNIEYDRNTEHQYQLLAKIYGYVLDESFFSQSVFFIFDNLGEPQNNNLSRRIRNFMNFTEEAKTLNGDSFSTKLGSKDVEIYVSPAINAVSQIANIICKKEFLYSDETLNNFLDKDLFAHHLPFDVTSIELGNDEFFPRFVKVINDSYKEVKIPILPMYYLSLFSQSELQNIEAQFQDKYERIILLYDSSISSHYYHYDFTDFFLPVYPGKLF